MVESVLRFGLSLTQAKEKNRSAKSLLRDSQVLGFISQKDNYFFSELLTKRNAISHGLFADNVYEDELWKAVKITKRIYNELIRYYINDKYFDYINYLRNLQDTELGIEIDNIIGEVSHELLNHDAVVSKISMTNAFGWYCDEYMVENIEFSDTECIVTMYFHATGEQDEDKVYHGTSLTGTADAVIDAQENVHFQNVTATLSDADGEVRPMSASFYVNRQSQSNGDHEVHKADCPYLPNAENRIYLGDFTTCYGAVQEARKYYSQVNGCYYCSRDCHTS